MTPNKRVIFFRRRLAGLMVLVTVLLSVLTPAVAALPETTEVDPIEMLQTGDYARGIVVDTQGNLFFSHGRVVSRLSPSGDLTTWAETGSPAGHQILSSGEHLICDTQHRAVIRYSPEGRFLGYAAWGAAEDLRIREPCDLAIDPFGGFYFTDSSPVSGAVLYVNPKGEVSVIARNLDAPSGIELTPERDRLYVSESRRNRILVIDLADPGQPAGEPHVFAELPPNREWPGLDKPAGLALDREGRVWVAHFGMRSIHVLGSDGQILRTYNAGNIRTSDICFAGPKFSTLYTVGGNPGSVYRLDVNVPGQPLLPAYAFITNNDADE